MDILIKMKLPSRGSESPETAGRPTPARARRWDVRVWRDVLRIPVADISECRYSKKPYKWLRFISGIILDAEGDLRLTENPESPKVDYESDSVTAPAVLYYHVDAAGQIFPLDPEFMNKKPKTHTTTTETQRSFSFRKKLLERDGGACVVTGLSLEYACDGAHLVARDKGSAYIQALTAGRQLHRSESDTVVTDIDDVRNGLTLNATLHRLLGIGFAILKTPNFAMTTEDVIAEEGSSNTLPGPETVRYTGTFFNPTVKKYFPVFTGVEIRQPKTAEMKRYWPPAALFDCVYAAAVVARYGEKTSDGAFSEWGNCLREYASSYHVPYGPMTRQCAEEQEQDNAFGVYIQEVRPQPGMFGRKLDHFDMVDLLRLSAMEPGEITKLFRSLEEEADEEARVEAEKESEDAKRKVETWMGRLAENGQ